MFFIGPTGGQMYKKLNDIISHKVIGVPPGISVSNTMQIMQNRNISCILILDNKKPVGIFTERDIVRSAEQFDSGSFNEDIQSLMTCPVLTAEKNKNRDPRRWRIGAFREDCRTGCGRGCAACRNASCVQTRQRLFEPGNQPEAGGVGTGVDSGNTGDSWCALAPSGFRRRGSMVSVL